MFPGQFEMDQLQKVFDIVGTPTEQDWPEKAALTRSNFRVSPTRRWLDVVPEMDEQAQDLVQVCMKETDRNLSECLLIMAFFCVENAVF